MAICTPLTSAPARSPASVLVPKSTPKAIGVSITRHPGGIISTSEASVEMATQRA